LHLPRDEEADAHADRERQDRPDQAGTDFAQVLDQRHRAVMVRCVR